MGLGSWVDLWVGVISPVEEVESLSAVSMTEMKDSRSLADMFDENKDGKWAM